MNIKNNMRRFFILGWVLISLNGFAQTSKKGAVKKPVAAHHATTPTTSLTRGKLIYRKFCLSCHQPDGGGVPNLNPPLAGAPGVSGSKTKLIKIVRNGFQDPVEIDGEYYSNNMPPFKMLTDQQVADVLTYIRKSFGNKATSVLKQEVTQYRTAKK
ncbi:cytochrome C [Niabella soli DSM 19437]|uniref:Cytochrome C n=2 Tax=Niabella TaxID=379899 RepID=W0F2G6_9BACT|nr:cytochrome C [Niabella soli DSM 19437]